MSVNNFFETLFQVIQCKYQNYIGMEKRLQGMSLLTLQRQQLSTCLRKKISFIYLWNSAECVIDIFSRNFRLLSNVKYWSVPHFHGTEHSKTQIWLGKVCECFHICFNSGKYSVHPLASTICIFN